MSCRAAGNSACTVCYVHCLQRPARVLPGGLSVFPARFGSRVLGFCGLRCVGPQECCFAVVALSPSAGTDPSPAPLEGRAAECAVKVDSTGEVQVWGEGVVALERRVLSSVGPTLALRLPGGGAPKALDQILLRLSLCASRPCQSEVGAEK